jgi:Ricin-type beta-trefoil lectin domain
VNARFGKCLDQDTNTYARNGGKVQLWACNWQSQQQWVFNPAPASFPATTGWYDLRMQGARSYCLDADSNQGSANGTKVQVWSCLNGTNQK